MIKFFRKIRQNLLLQNKTSKYFKYAIGEIVLVVIGILIALQINNWNEDRKIHQQELQIYSELKSDLSQTKKDIIEVISSQKKNISSSQKLFNAIKNKEPYSSETYGAFTKVGTVFKIIPKTSGFENLKNIGLNTLSNDSLRIAITNLFQLQLIPLKDALANDNSEFNIRSSLFPFQMKYFEIDYSRPDKIPFKDSDTLNVYKLKVKDFDRFINDKEFIKTLQLTLYTRSNYIKYESKIIEEIDNLLEKINTELSN
jgi:hypothetical protein